MAKENREAITALVTQRISKAPEKYGTDNIHQLTIDMIKEEYGIGLTPEMVVKIGTIDRARRKILREHPEFDMRIDAVSKLEEDSREFFKEGGGGTQVINKNTK